MLIGPRDILGLAGPRFGQAPASISPVCANELLAQTMQKNQENQLGCSCQAIAPFLQAGDAYNRAAAQVSQAMDNVSQQAGQTFDNLSHQAGRTYDETANQAGRAYDQVWSGHSSS